MGDIMQRLAHAIALGQASADNDNYYVPLTLRDAKDTLSQLAQAREELATLRGRVRELCEHLDENSTDNVAVRYVVHELRQAAGGGDG